MTTVNPSEARRVKSRNLHVRLSPLLILAACMGTGSGAGLGTQRVELPPMATAPVSGDPRVGLSAGMKDAGSAIKNLTLVGHVSKPANLEGDGGARGLTFANSDLAFRGNYVYQGNFSGFQIWDISNPASPVLVNSTVCATGQGDPSIYGNLLFVSSESTGNRNDCGTQGVQDRVSHDRMVGVRVYDVSNAAAPRKLYDIQTCRGSHTHTLVPDPVDKSIVYVYISGSAGVRSADELGGCYDWPIDSANSSRFRVEIIRVPLAHPELASVVNSARIFGDLNSPQSHGQAPGDVAAAAAAAAARAQQAAAGVAQAGRGGNANAGRGANPGAPRPGPNQCHDITVYPAAGYAGGACGGYGLLLDIKDPKNPRRISVRWATPTSWRSGTRPPSTTTAPRWCSRTIWAKGTAPAPRRRSDRLVAWTRSSTIKIVDGQT